MSSPVNNKTDRSTDQIQQWLTDSAAENAAGAASGLDEDGKAKAPGAAKGAKGGKVGKGSHGSVGGAAQAKGPAAGAAPGAAKDDIEKGGSKNLFSATSGKTSDHLGNEPQQADKSAQASDSHFDEVGGLADHVTGDTQASSATGTESATAQLSSDLSSGASDKKISKDLKGLNDAMQADGKGDQVASTIKTALSNSGLSEAKQSHVVDLAQAAGIDTGSTKSAKQELTQALSQSPPDTGDIKTKTKKYIDEERKSGTSDEQIGKKIDTMVSASGVSSDASAAALLAAVKNGIDPTNSGSDKVAAAKVKIKEKEAKQAAAKQAQQDATQESGSSGGSGVDDGGKDDGTRSADVAPASKYSPKTALSMDQLKSKVPARLANLFPQIEETAKKYNLQPQLLVAIAMQESTGGSDGNAYSNGGGMFQFTNTDTWAAYGSGGPDNRANDSAGVVACAKYMATLINDKHGNLNAALREYNGPVGQGGLASYQSDIYAKMNGHFG